jgi:hypothetical protein
LTAEPDIIQRRILRGSVLPFVGMLVLTSFLENMPILAEIRYQAGEAWGLGRMWWPLTGQSDVAL